MFNQTVEDRRRYLDRMSELHAKRRAELIVLACACWPNYRHEGVDDETLIGDILDYERMYGPPRTYPPTP